jgi:hypothetical protein
MLILKLVVNYQILNVMCETSPGRTMCCICDSPFSACQGLLPVSVDHCKVQYGNFSILNKYTITKVTSQYIKQSKFFT